MEADAFVVMPNHFHAVVVIDAITDVGQLPLQGQPQGIAPTKKPTLGDIVGAFKSITTVEYTRGVRQVHWLPFEGRLWQRNYYEHIVRSEKALNHIREYIETNPARWDFDRENPNRKDVDEFERWLEAHSTARRW
jgi:REP element-mobilizing transposase RayT